jgi:hypothetical protein
MAAKAKKEAVQAFDRGDYAASRGFLGGARELLACLGSGSTQSAQEVEELREIAAHLDEGDNALFRKKALWQSYKKKRGTE